MTAAIESKLNNQVSIEWDEVVAVIGTHMDPEDVFSAETLQAWAEDNGYVKET